MIATHSTGPRKLSHTPLGPAFFSQQLLTLLPSATSPSSYNRWDPTIHLTRSQTQWHSCTRLPTFPLHTQSHLSLTYPEGLLAYTATLSSWETRSRWVKYPEFSKPDWQAFLAHRLVGLRAWGAYRSCSFPHPTASTFSSSVHGMTTHGKLAHPGMNAASHTATFATEKKEESYEKQSPWDFIPEGNIPIGFTRVGAGLHRRFLHPGRR